MSKPSLRISDASPEEGSSVWLRCEVLNGTEPIHYMWQREVYSGNFTTFTQGNKSVINMNDLSQNHTGWYRCVASNAVSTERSEQTWINVTCEC